MQKLREAFDKLTDLELCMEYVEKCRQFVNPTLFGVVNSRGLIPMIDFLPRNKDEAKATLYARFVKAGKCFGDPEIDAIAQIISKVERLQKELLLLKVTEVDKRIPILSEMQKASEEVRDYFKKNAKIA